MDVLASPLPLPRLAENVEYNSDLLANEGFFGANPLFTAFETKKDDIWVLDVPKDASFYSPESRGYRSFYTLYGAMAELAFGSYSNNNINNYTSSYQLCFINVTGKRRFSAAKKKFGDHRPWLEQFAPKGPKKWEWLLRPFAGLRTYPRGMFGPRIRSCPDYEIEGYNGIAVTWEVWHHKTLYVVPEFFFFSAVETTPTDSALPQRQPGLSMSLVQGLMRPGKRAESLRALGRVVWPYVVRGTALFGATMFVFLIVQLGLLFRAKVSFRAIRDHYDPSQYPADADFRGALLRGLVGLPKASLFFAPDGTLRPRATVLSEYKQTSFTSLAKELLPRASTVLFLYVAALTFNALLAIVVGAGVGIAAALRQRESETLDPRGLRRLMTKFPRIQTVTDPDELRALLYTPRLPALVFLHTDGTLRGNGEILSMYASMCL